MISLTFLLSSLVVIVSPGPDLVLITRLALQHERRRPAWAAAIGMISAGALQAGLGFAGLTLLLQTNPGLFVALRWAGATVLLGWGLLALRSAFRSAAPPAVLLPELRPGRAYLQGLLCTGSNPKVGLFLMAFLPQFVPTDVAPAPAFTLLAAVYLGMGLLWLLVWITIVHQVSRHVFVPRVIRPANFLTGVVFVCFAIRLMLD